MKMTKIDTTSVSPASIHTQNSKKTRRRSVTFACSNELIQEFPFDGIQAVDKESLWYTGNEYKLIKSSFFFTVKMMESKHVLLDDNEMCTRGLESRTRAGTQRKRQHVQTSVDVVLYEQERQWEKNCYSPTRLAKVYRDISAQSSMSAFLAAQKDAKVVHGERHNSICKIQPCLPVHRPATLSERLNGHSIRLFGATL